MGKEKLGFCSVAKAKESEAQFIYIVNDLLRHLLSCKADSTSWLRERSFGC